MVRRLLQDFTARPLVYRTGHAILTEAATEKAFQRTQQTTVITMSSPEPEVANGKRDLSPRGKDDRSPSPRKGSPVSSRSRSVSRSASRSGSSRSRSKSSRSRSRSNSRSPRRRRSYSRSRSRSRDRYSRGDRYGRRDSGRDYGRDDRYDRGGYRGGGGGGYGGGGGGYGGGAGAGSRQSWRQGDWECDRCRAHNFATRGRCYACGVDKAPERGYRDRGDRGYGDRGGGGGGYGDRGGGGGSDRGAPAFKPGDWNCPDCSAHNFASRQACYKCGANK